MATEYVVQGHYGDHGWEDVDAHDNKADAEQSRLIYDQNEPQFAHRIRKVENNG